MGHPVCRAKDGSVWLAPTRLALALAGGSSGQVQHDVTDGFVVVETNYRVRFNTTPLKPLLETSSFPYTNPSATSLVGFQCNNACISVPCMFTAAFGGRAKVFVRTLVHALKGVLRRCTRTHPPCCRRPSCGCSRAASASCQTYSWGC